MNVFTKSVQNGFMAYAVGRDGVLYAMTAGPAVDRMSAIRQLLAHLRGVG